jgi:hypothetical protein
MASKLTSFEEARAHYTRMFGRDTTQQIYHQRILNLLGVDWMTNPIAMFYREVTQRQKQWWERDTSDSDRTVQLNLIHQIIEDRRAYMGAARSLRVPLPSGLYPDTAEDDDGLEDDTGGIVTAQEYASELEHGAYHLMREWGMVRQWSSIGWYTFVLGQGVGVSWFSKERGIPVHKVRSPMGFYADPDMDDETRLERACLVQTYTGISVAAKYPKFAEQLEEIPRVDVIDYYDKTTRMKFCLQIGEPLMVTSNPFGFVPVYIYPGILMPNSTYGASVMQLAIPVYNEIQRLYSMEAELLLQQVRAPTQIKDPINVPEGWIWGDDAVVEVGPQGGISKVPLTVVDFQMLGNRIQDMRQSLDDILDFPSISRGNSEGEWTTGKGTQALLQPNQQRASITIDVHNEIFTRVIQDALLIWRKLGKPGPIFGKTIRGHFSQNFNPKDINPKWVRCEAYLDSSPFVDRSARSNENLQMLRGKPQGMSQGTFLAQNPDIDDPEEEMKRMREEEMADAKQQAQITTMMVAAQQPPQPQGPPPDQSGGPGGPSLPGAPPGASGPPLPPPPGGGPAANTSGPAAAGPAMPGGPGGTTGAVPAPSGPPAPDESLNAICTIFRSIKKIKGQVYLCGFAAQGDLSKGIEIYLTDPNDKATIVNFFDSDPKLKQISDDEGLIFHPDPPTGDVIEVTPGTTDNTPTQLNAGPAAETPGPAGGGPAEADQQSALNFKMQNMLSGQGSEPQMPGAGPGGM